MRATRAFLCLSAALAALTPIASAIAAGPTGKAPAAAVEQRIPDEVEPSFLTDSGRFSTVTGAPLALYNLRFPVSAATPEAQALQFLKANARLLGLRRADLADLEVRTLRGGPAGTTVRFAQSFGGVPVYKGEIAVTLDPRQQVSFVASTYRPTVSLASTTPSITAGEARQAALDHLGVEGELNLDRTRLIVYHNQGISRLAWEVKLLPQETPVGDWEVLVDAVTGELFKVADVALYAPTNGTGNIFDPDPLSSAHANYDDPGFTDGADADTSQLTGQLLNVVLRDIDLTGGTFSLVGPWAAIGDFESPRKGTFSQATSAFNFTRSQDGFEAVHTYYHIDNIMRWVNIDLGLSITPFQYSGGVQFDPHGLNGQDNSHYTSAGQLAFGEGGVDDAEDADVVIHELGHGLHDWVTNGSLSQVEGLSEGFGDYLAASYSRSLGQWTSADPQFQWVFNWDGHNPFWNGRITNYGAIYPSGLVGQIHTDGQIWSTCNMKIWDAIGRTKIDKAMLSGLGMTNSGTNQQDAAQAVLQAAVNLGYPAADLSTMESIYQGCGYSVSLPSVCGNGIREGAEECDGADLGGATCADRSCTGGTVSCTASCTLDFSACTGCAQCNFDGVCDLGEDCVGCSADCISGTAGAVCGNGVCEAGDGETCVTCAADCAGQTSGNPNNRFCCGFGDGLAPDGCGDPVCNSGGFTCSETPTTPVSYCCGDLICEGAEDFNNCGVDCVCTLGQTGDPCTSGADCCSGVCQGRKKNLTCA